MIDEKKRASKREAKERVRRRMQVQVDPENYEYIPAKKTADYYDNETPQRVAIYVRVSTDDIRQTTSYELQKKYYEDFVNNHPNWELVNICLAVRAVPRVDRPILPHTARSLLRVISQRHQHLPLHVSIDRDLLHFRIIHDLYSASAAFAFHPPVCLFKIEIAVHRAADRARYICLLQTNSSPFPDNLFFTRL